MNDAFAPSSRNGRADGCISGRVVEMNESTNGSSQHGVGPVADAGFYLDTARGAVLDTSRAKARGASGNVWPPLPLESWLETYTTLHMWTQIVGKIRLELSPRQNHWWHVPLYVSAHGLATSMIPHENGAFQIELDLAYQELRVVTSWDGIRRIWLEPGPVAQFYHDLMSTLHSLGIPVKIWTRPVAVKNPIRFEVDDIHCSYDPDYAVRFGTILMQVEHVLQRFRSGFLGKCSPIHFFWGSFDLAMTRFSGRAAPPHPGNIPNLVDRVVREALSHELSSWGFWPGGGMVDGPAFYAYAYPEPRGYAEHPVSPEGAFYHEGLREFILPYDVVRSAYSPDEVLFGFLQSTYEAAANTGAWDRTALERTIPPTVGITRTPPHQV